MKKLFLLGDSIRLGYEPFLRQNTDLEIYAPEENCQFAQYALRHLPQWAEGCPAGEIDLVVWNCGLWDVLRMYGEDCQTPPDAYVLMLRRLCRLIRLLFPKAKLLFLTSTPTIEARYTGPSCRRNEDIEAYNDIAGAVMTENQVPVLDLYAVAEKFPLAYWKDHVHYMDEGFQALAEAITGSIAGAFEC